MRNKAMLLLFSFPFLAAQPSFISSLIEENLVMLHLR